MAKRILVIGELNIDMILSGLDALPALGQETVAGDLRIVMGSSSAICAAGLARLGAEVDFVGKVGLDQDGDYVLHELRRLHMGTDQVIRDPAVRTGITISLTYPGDRAMVTYLGSIAELRFGDINLSLLGKVQHLHVGSYFLQRGLQPDLLNLFGLARQAGLTTSLDTGWDPEGKWGEARLLELLAQVDLFLPNEGEARTIAGTESTEQALRELGQRAKLVVVKQGAVGAMALQGEQIVHSPGFPVDVVDTTGAGDSFDAGFIFAHIIQQQPLEEALRFANACGALSATAYGGTSGQPNLPQVLSFLQARQ